MTTFSRRGFFYIFIPLLALVTSATSVVNGSASPRPTLEQHVNSVSVSESNVLFQGDPAPQLCDPENPSMTLVNEMGQEQIDDQTIKLTYTNGYNQTFAITIISQEADSLQSFLTEGKLCLEAVQSNGYPPSNMLIDIPFGEIFINSVQNALATAGVELPKLVELRDELSEAAIQNETDGPTLRYLLEQLGVDSSEIDAIPDNAITAAKDAVQAAVQEERLDAELGDQLIEQISQIYPVAMDEPDAASIPSDPDDEFFALSFEVELTDSGQTLSENDDYIIFSVFDPVLYPGSINKHVWKIRPARWMAITVMVTGGRVSAVLKNGSIAQWDLGIKTYVPGGDNALRSPWMVANKLVVRGWASINSYDCSCYPLVKKP
ncbi:MAG TPA: hypothetical protein VHL11_25685 [Phototrophicaceae bacterium]|jgi:hypothetical protein|nr:hypothetical protein [Phototrophicaceae bacterium]